MLITCLTQHRGESAIPDVWWSSQLAGRGRCSLLVQLHWMTVYDAPRARLVHLALLPKHEGGAFTADKDQ